MRGGGVELFQHADDLGELGHQIGLVVQPAGGVDQQQSRHLSVLARLAARRRRGRRHPRPLRRERPARRCARPRSPAARRRRPGRCRRRRASRPCRSRDRNARKLADGGGLAAAVDADDEHDMRRARRDRARGLRHRLQHAGDRSGEDLAYFFLARSRGRDARVPAPPPASPPWRDRDRPRSARPRVRRGLPCRARRLTRMLDMPSPSREELRFSPAASRPSQPVLAFMVRFCRARSAGPGDAPRCAERLQSSCRVHARSISTGREIFRMAAPTGLDQRRADPCRPCTTAILSSAASPAARRRAARSRRTRAANCGMRGRRRAGARRNKQRRGDNEAAFRRPGSGCCRTSPRPRWEIPRSDRRRRRYRDEDRARSAERNRIRAAMTALHALEDQIVAGLQGKMQMRHQPRFFADQPPECLIHLDRVDRGEPEALATPAPTRSRTSSPRVGRRADRRHSRRYRRRSARSRRCRFDQGPRLRMISPSERSSRGRGRRE